MVWQELEIVRRGEADLPLSEVQNYCRFQGDTSMQGGEVDALLNAMRSAVPVGMERALNRAVFAQRRAYTALLAGGETLSRVVLEPHTGLTVTSAEGPLATRSVGTVVLLTPEYRADDLSPVRFEYDAGWTNETLPADLREAMLYEVMVRFVRRQEAVNQSETLRLPKSRPMPIHYQIWPDPVRRAVPVHNTAAV